MRKNIIKVLDLPSSGLTSALIIISAMFLIGSVAGCAVVSRTSGDAAESLNSYLDGFLNVLSSEDIRKPTFVFTLWKAVRWPLFALILGLTPIGLIGTPILVLIRSFLLSFAVSSFFQTSGINGLIFAFSAVGITGLLYTPIFFLSCTWSFLNSGTIIGRITGESKRSARAKRSDFLYGSMCLLVLFICCFIEYSVGMTLLKFTAEAIF